MKLTRPALTHDRTTMPTDLTSEEMAKLLVILEAAEEEVHNHSLFAIRQLANLHEEAKTELANSVPKDRSANPIVEQIATAMVKRRAQGA